MGLREEIFEGENPSNSQEARDLMLMLHCQEGAPWVGIECYFIS